jgi:hypothetical protein
MQARLVNGHKLMKLSLDGGGRFFGIFASNGRDFLIIHVKDPPYNAAGDGVRDDGLALRAAFAAARGPKSPAPPAEPRPE